MEKVKVIIPEDNRINELSFSNVKGEGNEFGIEFNMSPEIFESFLNENKLEIQSEKLDGINGITHSLVLEENHYGSVWFSQDEFNKYIDSNRDAW